MNIKENTRAPVTSAGQTSKRLSLAKVLELADIRLEPVVNKCLFAFARGLYALHLERGEPFSLVQQREMFSQWYEHSLDHLYPEDGGFDDLFFDLLEKFDRVKVPLESDFAEAAWQIALITPYPPEADQFQQDELKQLTAFCWQLQLASGDGPFYLSCRKVQTLMRLNAPEQAARRLRGLVRMGVLEVVEQGGPKTNRATRYRYAMGKGNSGHVCVVDERAGSPLTSSPG